MRATPRRLLWVALIGAGIACPSEPPPHPIHVDQSDVEPHCGDYCTRAIDTGLPSGVECECPPATEDESGGIGWCWTGPCLEIGNGLGINLGNGGLGITY